MKATLLDLSNLLKDRRHVVVGDIHSCSEEFELLLAKVNFDPDRDILVSLGDLFDRGPYPLSVLNYCMLLQSRGLFYGIRGNHDDKLIRYLKGSKVKIKHGLQGTIDALERSTGAPIDKAKVLAFLEGFHHIIKLPKGYAVHAGFNPTRSPEEQESQDCLFMRYFGGKDYFDNIGGQYWYYHLPDDYPNTFSGHEYHESSMHHRVDYENDDKLSVDYLLDGGCCFGGELRLWDSKDGMVRRLQALRNYTDKELVITQERRLTMLEEARKNINE